MFNYIHNSLVSFGMSEKILIGKIKHLRSELDLAMYAMKHTFSDEMS